jgi:DNA-binding NarL/FixJ family response regulator
LAAIQSVRAFVAATDPISYQGVVAALHDRPTVSLVGEDEIDAGTVLVVVTDALHDDRLREIKRLRQRGPIRVVLVVPDLAEGDLLVAIDAGVCAVVRRSEATGSELEAAIRTVALGNGSMPPDLLGRLFDRVHLFQQHVLAPNGLSHAGLTDRELGVLRLVAEGLDTQEIAARLCYSERTIKSIIHDVTGRLHLRNRSHAVAFAMREGLL